jgi:hypothetical protein
VTSLAQIDASLTAIGKLARSRRAAELRQHRSRVHLPDTTIAAPESQESALIVRRFYLHKIGRVGIFRNAIKVGFQDIVVDMTPLRHSLCNMPNRETVFDNVTALRNIHNGEFVSRRNVVFEHKTAVQVDFRTGFEGRKSHRNIVGGVYTNILRHNVNCLFDHLLVRYLTTYLPISLKIFATCLLVA